MHKLKVSILFPRLKYLCGDLPLGVSYLASYLKKNSQAEVSIIDTTFIRSRQAIIDTLTENKPDILGIYSDIIMSKDALGLGDWAVNNGIYTVFGGPYPTISPESFIDHGEAVIRGEGEDAFCQLVNNFSNKDFSGIDGLCWKKDNEIIRNNQRKNYLALDQIPFPAWDLLPMDKYIYHWYYLDSVDTGCRGTTMIASRGCPFSCSYCQPTLREIFGKEVRLRSPVNVVEEIKELKSRYGINGVFFHDDTMTMNHKWLGDFCRLMSSHKGGVLWSCNSRVDTVNEDILKMMYDAGLRNIHFGIEAGSQRILNQVYNKKIRLDQAKDIIDIADRIGISTMGFFMLGAPSETEEEIRSTMRLARNLRLDEASFSLVTPLAGTDLFNSVIKDARYTIKNDSSALNYYSHYAIEGGIEESRIKFLQLKALILFYTHPRRLGYILRHALSIKGMSKLLNKIRRFF